MTTMERVAKVLIGGVVTAVGYVAYMKGIELMTKGAFNITD